VRGRRRAVVQVVVVVSIQHDFSSLQKSSLSDDVCV